MKHISLLSVGIIAMLMAIPAEARLRSSEEIFSAAQSALQNQASTRQRVQAMGDVATLKLFSKKDQVSIVGYPEGGYAVISHDDRLPAVLAYCEGTYEDAEQNTNFRNYMAAFDAFLNDCQVNGVEPHFIGTNAVLGHPEGVKEIMKCKWDQGAPYNYLTPTLYRNGEDVHCATGCVATALSQILYTLYQQHDVMPRPRGIRRYYYLNGDKRLAYENANLSALDIVWKNMRNTYTATTTHACNMAVARLMYACGIVSKMTYTPGESGAYCYDTNDGVNTFFEGVHSEFTGQNNFMAFEQRFYDELDAKRPFLVSGNNGQGGHAFVADGYDSEGRLHLNMGWSGGGNGYYAIADMNGFSQGQGANFITLDDDESKFVFSKDKPLPELAGHYATADINNPATSVEPNRWYVLFNAGRFSAIYSSGLGRKIQNTNYVLSGDKTENVASMLVRFIPKNDTQDTYYIQTGTGDYFGNLTSVSNTGTTSDPIVPYTIGHMFPDKAPRFLWMKQGTLVVDCNAPGGQGLAGWGTTVTPDSLGNSCWLLLPAHLGESETDKNGNTELFNTYHRYTIRPYENPATLGVRFRSPCTVSTEETSEFHIKRYQDGWSLTTPDDIYPFYSTSSGFKVGKGTQTEKPLTIHFEPSEIAVTTADEDFNATSRVFRMRCETGYIGLDNVANYSYLLNNKGLHSAHTLWIVTDQTEYDRLTLPESITRPTTPHASSATPYDLQGRPLSQQKHHHEFHIEGGQKKF